MVKREKLLETKSKNQSKIFTMNDGEGRQDILRQLEGHRDKIWLNSSNAVETDMIVAGLLMTMGH